MSAMDASSGELMSASSVFETNVVLRRRNLRLLKMELVYP